MIRRAPLPACLIAALSAGCGPAMAGGEAAPPAPASTPAAGAQTPSAAAPPAACDDKAADEAPVDLADTEVIAPDRAVPSFAVATSDCRPLRSGELLGKRPVVFVFFSSWCAVCDRKMPVVKRAIEDLGAEATFLGVALDDDDTWDEVPGFVARYELDIPVIRGAHFRRFSLGYNPFQSVPAVVVVGRDGRLVDLQLGYSPFDYNRLVGAVEVAKR